LELSGEIVGNLGLTGVLVASILLITIAAAYFFDPKLSIAGTLIGFVFLSPVLKILPVDWAISGGVMVVGIFLLYMMGDKSAKT